MQFWDMPGRRELLEPWIMPNLRGTDCCIIVYDVTSLESFESLEYWRTKFLKGISLSNGKWFPFVVVGNKIDLHHKVVGNLLLSQVIITRKNEDRHSK